MSPGLSSFWDELVATGDDLHKLLELIARRAAEVVGEASILTTVADDGETLEPAAVFHADADVKEFIRRSLAIAPIRIGDGVAGSVAARRQPAVHALLDSQDLAAIATPQSLQFLERYRLRSLAVVPMIAFGDVVGTLGVVRTVSDAPYTDEDVMVLEALAERAALALADVRRQPKRIGPVEYEAIFRQSIDGVLFTVPDGRILAANPAACEILRRPESEICRLGRSGILALDDPVAKDAVAQRAITGRLRAELPMRRGDGEVFVADVSSTIFTTPDGEPRASVIFRDVSERVRSQQELATQHEHLALLHDITRRVNESDDVDAAIQYALDAIGAATGWPLGDALILSGDGMLRPTGAWLVADEVRFRWFRRSMQRLAIRADEGLAGRVMMTGAPVWVRDLEFERGFVRGPQLASVPLRSYVGVPIMVGTDARGVLELFADDTRARDERLILLLGDLGTQLGRSLERAEIHAAHVRLDEARAVFVARAAHELRSPVAALSVAVGVLSGRSPVDPETRRLVEIVERSTERLRQLVHRLLDLSELEHGTTHLTLEPVDVGEVVARSLEVEPPPAGRSVTSTVRSGTHAMADALSLEQIVTNLLVNAYRYGGDHVRVEAEPVDGRLRVVVCDDGPGADPTVEASLFEPFARAGGRRGEGSGLGLAICRRLASAMGASLDYERAGDETRFVLDLAAPGASG